MTAGPIFVGGLSHSGKTPLRMVLSAHPDLALTRHTHLWDRWYGQLGDLRDPKAVHRGLVRMADDPGVAGLAPDVGRVVREFREGAPTYGRLFGLLHEHAAERVGARRWGDQVGFVERHADAVFDDFPAARMVHMIRDPRDRLAAVFDDTPARPGHLGWETAKWVHSARLAIRNRRRYGDHYLVVPYEALVADPEGVVRRVCRFVGEDRVEAMTPVIAGLRFDGAVATSRENEFVERRAAHELASLGYRCRRSGGAAGTPRGFEAVDRMGMTAWRVLARRRLAPVGS